MIQELETKKYPLTNDLLFKAVFGRDDETSKYLLKELLNALLHLEGSNKIKDLTHKNPFSIVSSYAEKETIFDIKVELDNGEQVDIEMQVEATYAYRKRSLFYWARMHSEQQLRGKNYNSVRKSICINIVNSVCIHESKKLHNIFQVIDNQEHFVLTNDLEIHYFQLPNLSDIIMERATKLDAESELSHILDDEEMWLLFIREVGRDDESLIRSLLEKKEVLKMTYEAYDKLNKDALMKEKLEAHQKYLWDRSAREEDARKEGIEQGLNQGIEQGLNQGIEQGIEQTKRLIARSLLENGIQDELILKNCNITLDQLNELRLSDKKN